MKKLLKYVFLLLLLGLTYVVYTNYPRLNIITGYAAKSATSVIFMADRTLESVNNEDNNFEPINAANVTVNTSKKSATANVFGLKKRTAIYRDGLGAVLINDDYVNDASYLVPKRNKTPKNLPFPYGDSPQKDTVFSNIDYQKLNNIVNKAFDSSNKTRSVLVIYKDQIISEKNAEGFDEHSLHLGWSMTKSITATMYGILQKQGKLHVTDTAPINAWKDDERLKITIDDLLHMNSGLEWNEDYDHISDVTRMLFLDTDMSKRQIEKPLVGKPNETWNYSSGTTNLLSGMLKHYFKTDQEYLDFWYAALIDKIGMHSMLIEADLTGNYVGSSYGWATTRDWAKFGLLYLHNGNWNGEQIFEPSWSTYVATPTNTSEGRYGGHFWLNAGGYYPDAPKTMYSVNGYQGQRVFILPSKDLVIVRMGLGSMDFNSFVESVVASVN